MGQSSANNGAVARRQLSRELRKLRLAAGITSEDAAESLGLSASTMYRIENGKRPVSVAEARTMCELYKAPKLADNFAELARASKIRSWFRAYSDVIPEGFETYIGLEQTATAFRYYSIQLVPGIIQTEGYARAVIGHSDAADEEIERRVQLRLARQTLLTQDGSAHRHIILDAAVLSRLIGGKSVMREQLARLLEVADLPHVMLSILPFGIGVHDGMDTGSFVLMDFLYEDGDGRSSEPTTVYVEGLVGALYTTEEREVDAYRTAFDEIRKLALSPEDSKTAIIHAMNGMEKK